MLNGMMSLLMPHLDLTGAFLAYRSKPHAADAQQLITRLHAGISEFIAERFRAFIRPRGWKSGGR
jgi:hypothetical protein